ncbi:hypothetical protein M8J76_009141 [Diaphorina citri]|nr:hypothetical protein M8J76_009141 [Diaphorina citri]
MCSAFLSLTVVILACFSHLKCFFLPPEPDTPDPSSESVASYVNSSEFLAKWLEDPENQKIVAPIEDCTTETIASRMFTNTPHAEDWSRYNTNVTMTTVAYGHLESQIRFRLESYFQPPDTVNFTFVKALFIPLTQPKLMYRVLIVSDKFHKMSMFDRHNLTTSLVNQEILRHGIRYKHEQHCFVFTHDEWLRKKGNFMEMFSTLFYKIPSTAEVITFGPYGRRKRDVTNIMVK